MALGLHCRCGTAKGEKGVYQVCLGLLNAWREVRVVDEKGPFDGNTQRHRLKVALKKGPVYATVFDGLCDKGRRVQICE